MILWLTTVPIRRSAQYLEKAPLWLRLNLEPVLGVVYYTRVLWCRNVASNVTKLKLGSLGCQQTPFRCAFSNWCLCGHVPGLGSSFCPIEYTFSFSNTCWANFIAWLTFWEELWGPRIFVHLAIYFQGNWVRDCSQINVVLHHSHSRTIHPFHGGVTTWRMLQQYGWSDVWCSICSIPIDPTSNPVADGLNGSLLHEPFRRLKRSRGRGRFQSWLDVAYPC